MKILEKLVLFIFILTNHYCITCYISYQLFCWLTNSSLIIWQKFDTWRRLNHHDKWESCICWWRKTDQKTSSKWNLSQEFFLPNCSVKNNDKWLHTRSVTKFWWVNAENVCAYILNWKSAHKKIHFSMLYFIYAQWVSNGVYKLQQLLNKRKRTFWVQPIMAKWWQASQGHRFHWPLISDSKISEESTQLSMFFLIAQIHLFRMDVFVLFWLIIN